MTSGVLGLDLGDQPLPERERLGVRVVDPEDPHALLDPEADDVRERLPELAPGLRLEVERVDVLVLLGRVLGVLDRAVGPVPEPLGVLGDPGVVGRALEGQVERDVDAALARARQQVLEVREGAELGVDRGVAALGAADGPRAAEVARLGLGVVVRALAERGADRVDRRQVEDVEAELGDVVEPLLDVLEGAVGALGAGRAREQLVPGREARPDAVDPQRELLGGRLEAAVGVPAHQRGQPLVPGGVERRDRVVVDPGRPGLERAGVRAAGLAGSGVDDLGADLGVHRQVLPGVGALHEVPAPGAEAVDPARHGEAVGADALDREAAAPAIVAERLEVDLLPLGLGIGLAPVARDHRDRVVSVAEDVGLDDDLVADGLLGRKAAAVNRRLHALHDDAAAAFVDRDCLRHGVGSYRRGGAHQDSSKGDFPHCRYPEGREPNRREPPSPARNRRLSRCAAARGTIPRCCWPSAISSWT